MLDVRRMRVLREVAATGSFSAAAESLSFTQSAVSQHIAALEREAGAQLVDRGARGTRLTDAGRALVSHADAVIARLDDAEQELAAIAGLRGGRLRLGTFPSAGATLVPHAVASFSARHPEVELTMVEGEPEDTIPRLRAGDLDLAVVFDYEAIGDTWGEDFERVDLIDDSMDLVLPKGHRLAGRRSVKLADLSEDPWVSGCGGGSCARILNHVCAAAGFQPKLAFETNDYQAAQAFVAAGIGVAILPALALGTPHPDVAIRRLSPPIPPRKIWAAMLADSYHSPASEAMLQILQDVSDEFTGGALMATAA
jgi:molybdate transport repressor ModE-like protein